MVSRIYFQDGYKENYSLPAMETTPESEKQKPEYCRRIAEWFYSLYVQGKCELNRDHIALIDELRSYAKGTQDPEKYKSFFTGKNKSAPVTAQTNETTVDILNYQRKGWGGIDWDNVPTFIPTLITAIKGAIADNDYDIKADPIDYDSGIEEDRLMTETFVNSRFGPLFNQLSQTAGLPTQEYDPPLDYEELEQAKKEGVFKEPYIREHEKLLQHTENISKWDSILRTKHIEDLLTIGRTFEHAIYDKATSKVKWEYVNPRDVLAQFSDQHNFADSDFMGFLRWKSISELRACGDYISDGEKSGVKEKDLQDIASTYKNLYTNPDVIKQTDGGQDVSYNDFKVLEFVFYWRDVDEKKEIEYTNKFGSKRLYPYTQDVKKLSDREKIKVMKERRLYSCTWLVGTKWVYNYGLFPNQPYYKNMPWVPIRGVKLQEKSLVHRLVPVANAFAKSWFKMQNGLAKASEGGYAIDVTRLAMNDPKQFNPLGVVKAWREDNIFFYQSSANGMNVGGTPVPLNLIAGNLRELVEPHMQHLSWCISFAENLTGIPLIMLGATPKQDTAVGVTEMSIQSANNSLRELLEKIKVLKEDLAEGTSQMIQLAIKYDDRAQFEYSKIIGQKNIQFLLDASYLPTEYGISMKARPTMMERQSIIKSSEDALLNGRNGQPGISIDQALYIKEQVFAGANLGELRLTLRKWIEKDKIEKQKERDRAIQLQNEGQMKLEQAKGQIAQQMEALKMRTLQADYDLKTRSQMMIDNNKSIRTMDELIIETMAKLYGEAGVMKAQQIIDKNPDEPGIQQ